MRVIVALITLMFWGFSVQASLGGQIKLTQTYDRAQLRSACADAGGSFSANLNGHHCIKQCTSSSGQASTCSVSCDTGGSCTGSTPDRRAPTSQRFKDLLGAGGGMVLSR